MHRIHRAAVAALFLALPLAAQTTTSTDDTFKWSGKMPAGAWLHVANMNGSISVERATGDVAEVTGDKDWRRGDPKDVRFVLVKDGDNVTICALWGDESSCDAHGASYRSHGHHGDWGDNHNDVNVKFTVKIPKGIKLDVNTVNGGLDVAGAQAEVIASTVNGRVEVATSTGPVNAKSVNGSVNVRMDELQGDEDLDFSTVNGSVSVEVPSNFAGDLVMETVNGSLTTDFPLMISGKMNPKHIRATIGKGGRRVRMTTVNGSIELRKNG